MPFSIVQNDITKMRTDAIVNAANTELLMGGGVCGAIFHAAGAGMLQTACDELAPIRTGDAVITEGFALPAKYIVHTAGPIYQGGNCGEETLLRSCYINSLIAAKAKGCESIAFPLISSGIYGYPRDEALRVATGAIVWWLTNNDMDVSLVLFDKSAFKISRELLGGVQLFIDENFVDVRDIKQQSQLDDVHTPVDRDKPFDTGRSTVDRDKPYTAERTTFEQNKRSGVPRPAFDQSRLSGVPQPAFERSKRTGIERIVLGRSRYPVPPDSLDAEISAQSITSNAAFPASGLVKEAEFNYAKVQLDEPFAATLMRIIDLRGISEVDVYKRANIDRKLFSKIRSGKGYMPSKKTVVALAVALELSLAEARNLLERAGFALSRSVMFDVIVEYFITQKQYDIYVINNVLFAYDQPILGG